MSSQRKKIALWHRYGPADHTAVGGHAIPRLVELLDRHCDVHVFGMRTATPVPALILEHATIHHLPFRLNRKSTSDKILKTILWYLALPCIALRCRFMGVSAVYMDETLPLAALIAQVFFGKQVVITVADFFTDIYLGKFPGLRLLGRAVTAVDFASWRRLPFVFTKVKYTRDFLAKKGIPPDRVHPSYNPCDCSVYFPMEKLEPRKRFGLQPQDMVLVHHGVLHPNKGNDRIIRAVAELKQDLPNLRYLLVGAGPELDPLKRLTRDLGLESTVIFTGWLPTEQDVNMALNAGDIGLVMRIGQPSDNFHLTDTLTHEMACGLPILAVRLTGIAEVVVEGDTGFLFNPDDMTEFQSKVKKLAADPALRSRLGTTARRLCSEQFDLDKIARGLAVPLLELIGEDTSGYESSTPTEPRS